MKKCLLLPAALLTVTSLWSQFIIKDGYCNGAGPFVLDDTISKFTALHREGGYKTNDRQYEVYSCSTGVQLTKASGESFKTALLTFNNNNKLVYISFIKFYRKQDTRPFKKRGQRLYEGLIGEATEKLNKKGEDRHPPSGKKYVHKEQAWFDDLPDNEKHSWLRIEYQYAKGKYSSVNVHFGYRGE